MQGTTGSSKGEMQLLINCKGSLKAGFLSWIKWVLSSVGIIGVKPKERQCQMSGVVMDGHKGNLQIFYGSWELLQVRKGSSGQLVLRAPQKPSEQFFFFFSQKIGFSRRLVQLLVKCSPPKAGASQGKHELKIIICTIEHFVSYKSKRGGVSEANSARAFFCSCC